VEPGSILAHLIGKKPVPVPVADRHKFNGAIMKSDVIRFSLSALALCAVGVASADQVKLDFEGIGDQVAIGSVYSSVGVLFVGTEPALAITAKPPGTGNIAGNPSGTAVMYFEDVDSNPDTVPLLQYAAGFKDGFSFSYSAINFAGQVSYYSDLDGVNLIGSLNLSVLQGCATTTVPGAPGNFCNWKQESVLLGAGVTVKSIRFGGIADQIAFDDVVLGVAAPVDPQVPEPATLALVGVALLGAAMARCRKV
jgi:hypothetical protein